MFLDIYPQLPPHWDQYEEWLDQIPESDFYLTLNQPLIIPYWLHGSPWIISTDAYDQTFVVSIDGQPVKSFHPIRDGKVRLDRDAPLGYVIDISFTLDLERGESIVAVRSIAGSPILESSRFVVSVNWAGFAWAASSNIYYNIREPILRLSDALLSPWGMLFLENKLPFQDLFLDVKSPRIHSLKMISAGLFERAGTNRAILDFLRGLTYNTPSILAPSDSHFLEWDFVPESSSMMQTGYEIHTWLPCKELGHWMTLLKLAENLPDRIQLLDYTYPYAKVRVDGQVSEHWVRDGSGISCPSLGAILDDYPRIIIGAHVRGERLRPSISQFFRYPINQYIKKPLGPRVLSGENWLSGTVDLNTQDGADHVSYLQELADVGFIGCSVNSTRFASWDAPPSPLNSMTGYSRKDTTLIPGPQTRCLGIRAWELPAESFVNTPIPTSPLAIVGTQSLNLEGDEDLNLQSLPVVNGAQRGDVLLLGCLSIGGPILKTPPSLRFLGKQDVFVVGQIPVFFSLWYRHLLEDYQADLKIDLGIAFSVSLFGAVIRGTNIFSPILSRSAEQGWEILIPDASQVPSSGQGILFVQQLSVSDPQSPFYSQAFNTSADLSTSLGGLAQIITGIELLDFSNMSVGALSALGAEVAYHAVYLV